jgi:beta-lactamase regulating signal transducer with metallopeptidase domain
MNITLQALALALTLVHFCWQAMLIAGAYKVTELFLAGSKPAQRYLLTLAALLAMVFVAALTFVFEVVRLGHAAQNTMFAVPLFRAHLNPKTLLPWLDLAWLVGVLALTVRMMGNLWSIHGLSRTATEVPEALLRRFADLVHKAGVSNRVQVRLNSFIAGPFVVGVFRAVVYLPVSAVTQLTPAQLDAVLRHELEHIRRFDYLWNLVQTLVETLFFYHPAVWWLGQVLREQRELCCDDAALGACGDPLVYATALLRLEEQRPHATALTLGMALNGQGSGLLPRIARMLGEAPVRTPTTRYNPQWAVPLILLALAGFVVPAAQVTASTPVPTINPTARTEVVLPVEPVPPARPAEVKAHHMPSRAGTKAVTQSAPVEAVQTAEEPAPEIDAPATKAVPAEKALRMAGAVLPSQVSAPRAPAIAALPAVAVRAAPALPAAAAAPAAAKLNTSYEDFR